MSLVHDPREIADVHAVEPALLGIVGIICMCVGVNHITEDNVREFYARVNMMERLTGAFRSGSEDGGQVQEVLMTVDEAKTLIGYRTNVTPMTKAKFKGHLFNNYERLVLNSDWRI